MSHFSQHATFLRLGIVLMLGLLAACSAEKNTLTSKAYHNTTARFNAYFIAREHIKEVEKTLEEAHKNNFNKVLLVNAPLDTTLVNSQAEILEDAFKKASIGIQRHKNSKWVDDCYISVGLVRYYEGEYAQAIETFKYVNKTSEDDNARHQALNYLMRTFVAAGETNNALAVADYLKKQELNSANKKEFGLIRAHLYQTLGDENRMVQSLFPIASELKRSEGRARIYFIIGQVYQKLGYDALAYENYQACIKSNPDYELYFYARLNMNQVTELARSSDAKRVRKYFKKLLKDGKNKDFKDKIYYEMAEFEMKQNNIDQAIEFYNASVQNSTKNVRQKAYSYLKLGRIYYDTLRNYPLAKSYYDSTISVLPQEEEIYPAVKKRQQILEDFVYQLTTITVEDSLLKLAKLDSTLIMDRLSLVVEQQEKQLAEQQKREESKAAMAAANGGDSGGFAAGGEGGWYFYNATTISMGQSEFLRKWGDRPLQDNWRLSSKIQQSGPQANELPEEETYPLVSAEEEAKEAVDPKLTAVLELYTKIPFSEEAKKTSLQRIEEAYYALGNIYFFQLEERNNAAETFEVLLARFPESYHKPEVLYQLYLYYKEVNPAKSEEYKKILTEQFPNEIYTKMITNPNFREESLSVLEEVKAEYAQAYHLYKSTFYDSALLHIKQSLENYPENDFTDNLAFLEVLIKGKTIDYYTYQYELGEFIEKYPNSELLDYANELKKAAENFKESESKRKGTSYIKDFEQVHYGIILYENDKKIANDLPGKLSEFFVANFPASQLSTGSLVFDDKNSMILINEFKTKAEAEAFNKALSGDNSPLKQFPTAFFSNFVITKDNFQLFYQSKDVKSYLLFFEKNYQ
ncbi:tetratricopeptide repeat protein [Cytophagales bacterium LB-30]|uniref:Tetratricopeptide repeat protein n=1 Tax=Shiella aurantiaca TaxID=3058365 RepID=A0ABT8F6Z4_9BACT|nr:tetratricopeptide repeat protein [Shiella aurantiaca]MDN4166144.1 tetratricopeptide repeat protein [Shiella aurantiaca]